MKKFLLLLTLVTTVGVGWAQRHNPNQYRVTLNENSVTLPANFQDVRKGLKAKGVTTAPSQVNHFIMQFNSLPTVAEQKQLKEQGITLLNYLQGYAYYVSVSSRFYSISRSASKNIRSFIPIKPEYKIRQDLAKGNVPDYAKAGIDIVKVDVTYFKDVDETTVAAAISKLKITSVKMMGKFHMFSAEVSISNLATLSSLDWVMNIEPIAPPSVLDNDHGKSLHRANVLSSSIPGLGYGLTGKGVKIGLWDGDVYNHRDFNDRLVVREFESHRSDHGTHTGGTITGAGLLDPRATGMAPEAQLYAWNFNVQSNGLAVPNERLLALDNDGIEITSNSWGYNVTACPNPYAYNSTDHNEDLIAGWYPYFLYVFSAGNNQSICPGGFNTTSKNMKNSLMVAAVDELDGMSYFSSFGPSEDGRLIPNISGDGVDVYSTFFDNGYGLMSGTSMATPGVAGTMALVYQRYKDTHGGQQPASSLMRGLACNTAHDLGNFGPDYKYGFGEINGLRAVSVMEQNHYFIDTVSQGNTYTKDITVPSGAVGLKVMLSWTDPTGTVGASRILVNDLDLSVSNGGSITLPWVLDPANPSATAVRDYDGLNNLEQVTFSNPTAGTYTIGVDGFEIADGVQEFAVVYDIIMPTLKLTYPIGGENLSPGSEGVIRWDCEGYSNTFTIEYSADGGVNYSVIASNIPSSVRSYLWTLPAGTSSNAKIRISNGSVLNATKGVFNVMPVPQNIKVGSAQCGGAGPFALTWDVVANAKYEVLKLNGQVYEHLADVASNSYDITGITQSNNNWYCVRAIDLTTGAISERSLAVTVNPTVAVSTLPFIENFESQKTDNFYFTSVLGQGNVRYVNNAQKYGIRLEGTSGPTTAWLAGTDAACFTNNPNFVVKASICNIDATSLAGKNFRLKFDYRQKYRTAAGTSYFRVRVNGDILTNTDGTQIYGATNQVSYKSVYYDLAAYAGMASVVVEFEAVCKTNYTTYVNTSGNYDFSLDTYDVGDFVTIDNIEFLEPLSDMALTSLTVGAGNTAAETITVKVKNLSGEIVSDVPVSYTVNGGAVVSEVVPGPIAPIAEATYAFTQTADFSVGGVYSVVAAANWPNDPIASNNSMTAYKANNGTDILIGTGTPTTTCDGWLVDNAGRYADYAVSQTKTHRFIPGTAGKNVKITFTEFATEEGYDFVYVYNGNSTSAANLLGKFAGSALPPSITSSSANGNLTIKFTSDFDVNDMGFVAHIECVDKPAVDAAVTAITAPTASGIKTTTETVTFTLFNYGLTALTTYDMYYQIDNNTPVIESVTTDNIASATSLVKSFAVKADLSIAATYALKVWVVAVGDAIAENDSTTVSVVSLASTADAGVSAILTIRPSRVGTSTIAATIKNFGTTSISNFDVAYAINGDAEVVQAVVGPIAAGATSAITFTTKADFTAANNYNVDIYTKLAGDVLATNDTMSTQVVVVAPSALNVVGSFYGGLNVATASAIPAVDLVNNYTIEAWVNLSDPTNYGNIFNKTNVILDYTTTYGVAFYGTNSYLLRVTGATSSFIRYVPNSVKKGTWQHVALTVSSTNVYTLYIDGVAQTWTVYSGAAVATKTNSSNPISIGNRASDLLRPVNGLIDEVRVWNSCLDQSTISGNMMTDYAANTAGLLAYYKIKEGAGSYLFDYSSNDNTAIISGADVSGMGDGKFWNAPGLLLKNFNFTGEKVPTTFDANTNTFTSIMDAADLSALTANFTPSQQSVIMIGAAVQTSGSVLDFTSGTKNYTAEGFGFNTGISQNYTVNVSNDLSSACDLTAYSFETADNAGLLSSIVLDGSGNNFYKKVSSSLDLTALKALFTISPQATLAINNVAQANPQSSVVDYSSPVMVTVVSRNGRDFKNYSITVDARSSSADLTAFSIPLEQVGTTTIDAVNHTLSVWVKSSTDLTMLSPTFTVSPKAVVYVKSITQLNGITANNFTSSVVYTVVSEDESTSVNWTVTVTVDNVKPVITLVGDAVITLAKNATFTDPGATAIDNVDGNISSSIVVTGSVNTATSGDYILTYNVADAAGNTAVAVTRTITVDARSSSADLTAFSIPLEQVGTTTIDAVNHTLSVWVKSSTDLTMLSPTFTVSPKAVVYVKSITQLNGITANNFTSSVVYTVVSEDESTSVNWTVTVTVDNVKPVITLVGDAVITLAKNATFTDPGATAIDNVDGNISSSIVVTGSVNTATSGDYILTYNVADAAGNTAVAVTRTITVSPGTGVDDNDLNEVKIYSDASAIYVNIPELKGAAKFSVYNVIGKSVYQTTDLSQGLNRKVLNVISGVYMVKLEANGKVYTAKVVIR